MRLVKVRRCKKSERRVTWHQRGPVGLRGDAGARAPGRGQPARPVSQARQASRRNRACGPPGRRARAPRAQQGPAGAQGPGRARKVRRPQGPSGGISSATLVTTRVPAAGFDTTSPKTATAACGVGKVAVGGGFEVERGTLAESDLTKLYMLYSKPVRGLSGWTSHALEASTFGETWALSAYAICVPGP